MSSREANDMARERELDLVEVSPNANPPVCKIVDWGKYNYQKTKQLQKQKRSAKNPEIKQMRFGLKIGDHDLEVKLKKVTSFLEAGHKVKITLFYRGREMAHKDIGFKLAERVIASYGETIIVEQQPQLAGKQLSFVVRGNPSTKLSPKKVEAETTSEETKEPSIKGLEKIESLGEQDAKAKDA